MKVFINASLFFAFLIAPLFKCDVNGPQVTLMHNGMVEGDTIGIELDDKRVNVDQFLGIPYAEPPKRFANPKPHAGWEGSRKATEPSNICIQPPPRPGFENNNKVAKVFVIQNEMSEDCLYLNVWSPKIQDATANTKKPVMVWISGGAFTAQSPNLYVYNGSFLAASEEVIVVSMNYRVNAFGFFRLEKPDTDTGNDALGNQGLHDIELALQWVQDNIEKFGGDKDMVTVFGESAGGASASILWLSKRKQRLFKRATVQSGSVYARWSSISMSEAEKRADTLANACGCDTKSQSRNDVVECLRQVPAPYLLGNLSSVMKQLCIERNVKLSSLKKEYKRMKRYGMTGCLYFNPPFIPVRDGDMIAEDIDRMFENAPDSPELLVGAVKNEGLYFLLYGIRMADTKFLNEDGSISLPDSMNIRKSYKKLRFGRYASLTLSEIVGQNLIKQDAYGEPAYFYDLNTNSTDRVRPLMTRLDDLAGDLDFKCPTLNFANKVAQKSGAKVYMYSFEHRTSSFDTPPWLGVLHGGELEYLFGMPLSEKFQTDHYSFTLEEKELSKKMMRFWANFARTGNPNGIEAVSSEDPQWPQYTPSKGEHLILSSHVKTGEHYKEDACNFWRELENKYPPGN